MIRVISSQQYETCSLSGGGVLIEAPSSRLDGSLWPDEAEAGEAIRREQLKTQEAVDMDLAEGGPLMRGLALLSFQLQLLGWDELDVQLDLASMIVIFPSDEMLSVPDAHVFLEALIEQNVHADHTQYATYLERFQQSMFSNVT